MATAHLSVKVGKVGKGTPHAEYIARLGKYAKRLERGERLEFSESGNMPAWAKKSPLSFWQAADEHERKNGTVYREHEIALPRELTPAQRIDLVREWVRQELGERHAYSWSIHNTTALDGGEQPHVHLMFSERINDGIERDPEQYFKRYNAKHPEKGGAKKHRSGETPAERKAALTAMRERWAQLHNAHLARHGHKAEISMKTLAEQGIDRQPEPHMTPSESAALQRQAAANRRASEAMKLMKAERKRINTERVSGMSVIQLHREYQRFTGLRDGAEKKVLSHDRLLSRMGTEIDSLERRIEALKHQNEVTTRQYHDEYRRRESSFFGLGKIGMKIQKENAAMQEMQATYKARNREIWELTQEKKKQEATYNERLKFLTDRIKREADESASLIYREMDRRPLSEFQSTYERQKQNSITRAANNTIAHLDRKIMEVPADEERWRKRVYLEVTAQLEDVETKARPLEARLDEKQRRREYRKEHGRDDDYGMSM